MPRIRLGVVLVVPPPFDGRADGLRAAFGDPALDQVMPHITLVPPVNVHERDVPAALTIVRAAASRGRALHLRLGPIRVFPGTEHVAFLAVDGERAEMEALRKLRADVFQPPLHRSLEHDFVPHVTLTQGIDAARLAAVLAATPDLAPVEVSFDRIHLLHERFPDGQRWWKPVADVALGPPVIVGRGGLPLELTPSELLDPEARATLSDDDIARADDLPAGTCRLVVAARREGAVVGVVWGWTAGPSSEIVGCSTTEPDPDLVRHLDAAWLSAAADRGVLS